MTRAEAKTIFLNRGYIEVDGGSYFDGDKWRESITVISEWLKEEIAEPCEDAISRQAVEKIINDNRDCINVEGYWAILERMKKLPSVTPHEEEPKYFPPCINCNEKQDKIIKAYNKVMGLDKGYNRTDAGGEG